MASSGRLFPVCCCADVDAQLKDRFIQINQDAYDQMIVNFVFVDDMDKSYTEADEIGINLPSSRSSAFRGKNIQECHVLLKRLQQETGSDISYETFAIMDERSLEDDTVLLAQESGDGGGEDDIWTVRVAFEEAHSRLLLYLTGDADVSEDRRKAQRARDGVLRAS